jgi:NAD(P)-dependent dehydrogenase (short-subunit alcohol dehydrogenase family)
MRNRSGGVHRLWRNTRNWIAPLKRDRFPTSPLPIVQRQEMSLGVYASLNGRVVMVTGGASGIGEEIVRSFAAQGARVGFIDIDAFGGERLERELQSRGDAVRFVLCDLKDADALKVATAHIAEMLGPISVLVNNAANDDRHDWTNVTAAYFDERIATNMRHFFFAIQAVAPGMISTGGGSIINLGSISSWQDAGDLPIYAAAKAAIHGLTRSFARKLGGHRIRVNTVVPGWVMTERQKQLWATPEALKRHLQRQCLPDPIQPFHVARLVLFLASDDAAMCTGNNYMVEAGAI